MIKHKFNAKATELDGIRFPSKKEAKHYQELKMLISTREVLFFLRQVPFHLPGNIRYVCDFMVFWADGNVTIEDVKGMKTRLYETKKTLIEAIYPIKIKEI